MKEELLHYLWQQKVLLHKPLQTTTGKAIEVIKPGSYNLDSGPDFFNARIIIDGTTWAGNVEMHIRSSDWVKHQHHKDKAYNNVILHVVFIHDAELGIPTLELKPILNPSLTNAYQTLLQSAQRIPCQSQLALPDTFKLNQYLHRLAIERLEHKCVALEKEFYTYQNSWEKLFYVTLAKYFGMQVNAEPFVQLAHQLPVNLFAKHKHNKAQIDALIFGVGGFLPAESTDEYVQLLNREFQFLEHKYNLPHVGLNTWKFAKTRPANFPTIRLAQFSSLIYNSVHLFSKLMQASSLTNVTDLLNTEVSAELKLNELHHAQHPETTKMGKQFIHHLIINAVIPIKFLFGKHQLQENHCEQALQWLEELAPEVNTVTKFWNQNQLKAQHALHSQALIELNKNYCQTHKCLSCAIGNHILQQHA